MLLEMRGIVTAAGAEFQYLVRRIRQQPIQRLLIKSGLFGVVRRRGQQRPPRRQIAVQLDWMRVVHLGSFRRLALEQVLPVSYGPAQRASLRPVPFDRSRCYSTIE